MVGHKVYRLINPILLTYEMMADDYAALLSAMHIDSTNVIGWSDGGNVGLLLAIRHPEKVRKLVITGANLRPDSSAISPDVLKRVTKTYNMFASMFKEDRAKTPLDSSVFKFFKLLIEQPHISFNDLHKIAIPTIGYTDEFNKKTDFFLKSKYRKIEDRSREF